MNFKLEKKKNAVHFETYRYYDAFYLCACFIDNFSFGKRIVTQGNIEHYGRDTYTICLSSRTGFNFIEIDIISDYSLLKKDVSIFTPSRTVTIPIRDLSVQKGSKCCARICGEDFRKLIDFPINTCLIVYRFVFEVNSTSTFVSNRSNSSTYLKQLKADISKYSGALKEKVNLCVDKETESVNKAVLCVRSPVFAKMFRSQMREMKNEIIITDIKMPVIRELVSYLYTGLVPDGDFDFARDLFYAADKYDITELRLTCACLLISKVTYENLFKLLKLAVSRNNTLLKLVAMTMISVHIDTVITTSGWKNLMLEDPKLALEAITFFDF